MALIVADRVQETCNSPGVGVVTLLGAVAQFQTFSAAIGNGNTTFYVIADQTGTNWEVGIGTYATTGNTLTRTTILASSNAGSAVNFASGTQNVWGDLPAGKAIYKDASGNAIGLGTPAAFVATNVTGLPISTGVSGLAANIATFLTTPSSANLAAALTDETGSGSAVFSDNATLLNPTYTGTLTGGTGVIAIGTNQIYKDASGNVGIGTSSPVTSLTVQAGAGNGIKAYDSSATTTGTYPCIESIGSRGDANNTFGGRFGAGSRRNGGTAIPTGWLLGQYAFGGQWGTGTTYNQTNFLYAASVVGVSEGSFTSATAMPTALVFSTGSTGTSLQSINTSYGTERMRIDSSGNVTLQKNISVGGAVPTTVGTGITFPATQAASSDANTLDDYEEGVWTPVLTSGFTTTGTVTRTGYYTKVGRVVTVSIIIQATSVSPANAAVMSGLPFPVTQDGIGLSTNAGGTATAMPITGLGSTLIFGGVSISTPNLIGSVTYITT